MYYDVWDPVTNAHYTLNNVTQVDMFCAVAMVIPATGKIMIAGGDARPFGQVNYGITSVLQFDYRNKSLVKAPDGELAFPRWYPTAVTLANGTILVSAGEGDGSHGGMADSPYPELYTPGVGWKTLEGAADPILQKNWYYPRAWLKSDGEVIVYGAMAKGKGSIASIRPATATFTRSALCLSCVIPDLPAIMFDARQGARARRQRHPPGDRLQRRHPDVPDRRHASGQTRYWSNMTVLADGKVMISGGSAVEQPADRRDKPGRDLGPRDACR